MSVSPAAGLAAVQPPPHRWPGWVIGVAVLAHPPHSHRRRVSEPRASGRCSTTLGVEQRGRSSDLGRPRWCEAGSAMARGRGGAGSRSSDGLIIGPGPIRRGAAQAHAGAAGADGGAHDGRTGPVRTAGGWRGSVQRGRGATARYLVDATGRQRLRSRSGGRGNVGANGRPACAMGRVAGPGDAPQTRIRAIAEGWLWCARLPGDEVRLMAFVDPERMANGLEGTRQLFRRLLLQAPEMGQSRWTRFPPRFRCRSAMRPAIASPGQPRWI